MNATKLKFAEMPTNYSGLVAMHPPRPVHDFVDERNIEEIVTEMAGHKLTPDQEDYLDLLSDLLLRYQSGKYARRARRASPPSRLKFVMEQSRITAPELAKILGCSQPLISLILSGKRSLSKENIKKLAAHFRLDAGYFI